MDLKHARKLFDQHVKHCQEKQRYDRNGNLIEMRLSFEEWCAVWRESGKWELRGTTKGSYCMSRKNDIGHYEIGNVFIQLHSENSRQGMLGRQLAAATKAKIKNKSKYIWADVNRRAEARSKQQQYMERLRANPEAYAAFKQKCSEAGKKRPVYSATCPHCGKSGHRAAMGRWHFNNCPSIG
jgi:hypothetical protein